MKYRQLLFLIISCCFLTAAFAKIDTFEVTIPSPSTIQIKTAFQTKKTKLGVVIGGYEVNCLKTRMIIWGQTTKKLGIGVVPYSQVYVLNTKSNKVLNSYTVARGPYDARYLSNQKNALVDQYLIDLTTGKLLNTEVTDGSKIVFETCESFEGKAMK